MRHAPDIVIPCSSKAAYLKRYAQPDKGWTDRSESRWPVPYWWVDAGMAALLVLQTAVDEGLGACFFGIEERHLQAVVHGALAQMEAFKCAAVASRALAMQSGTSWKSVLIGAAVLDAVAMAAYAVYVTRKKQKVKIN